MRIIGDSLGLPIRLHHFASEQPGLRVSLQTPPRSVAIGNSVVELGKIGAGKFYPAREVKGQLQYWSGRRPYYGSSMVRRDDLEHFTAKTVSEAWSCDQRLRACPLLQGAPGEIYGFLDELAESEFPEMLRPITEEKIGELLQRQSYYREFSGITDAVKQSGRFERFMWDTDLV